MGKYEIKGEERRFVALLLSLAGLQIAAYYFAAAWVNGAGSLAAPQPDTLLYCQAARRICEGHAFSFSAGTAVSTGTTSVLYPFVLAIPYWLGCKGESLLTAGFALNAFFYLLFIWGWSVAFRQWLPKTVAKFAAILLVAFHQPVYCALAQSDTGIWMAISGLLAAAWTCGRWQWALWLAMIAPWVRPEGMMLAFAIALISIFSKDWRGFLIGGAGLVSSLGVLGFNSYLTGVSGFSSVAHKGYFSNYPVARAVLKATSQAYAMMRELVFSNSASLPRGFYNIPILGGLAIIWGAYVWGYKRNLRQLLAWVLAAAIAFLVVAQSGYQGMNNDRYLAWMMPIFVLFSANGFYWVWEYLGKTARARIFLVIPVLYLVLTSIPNLFYYHLACKDTNMVVRFAQEIDRLILDCKSVGAGGWSGIAYFLGDRHVANTGGIYSPEFSAKGVTGMLEVLKNEPTTRFDYWMLIPDDRVPDSVRKLFGATELPGPSAFELRRTNWTAFDRGEKAPAISNRVLRCSVDVGYEKDMRRSQYEVVQCYGMTPFKPLITVADLEGKTAMDTGLLVIGNDEMTVDNLQPGKEVVVCLRTINSVVGDYENAFDVRRQAEYVFDGPIGLHLSVDGREVACCHAHIDKRGFNDIFLKLPGKYVTSAKHRIGVHGDHAAFAYWFYQ